ncbi:MAG: recombinase family protein [Cyanobacteria bacterium J06627_8]
MSAEPSQYNDIRERLNKGRQTKASQGGYVGFGSPAFGQQSINGELVDNPKERQIIEIIRRHHKSGKSLQKIADWLNQHGYVTKRGHAWQRISVKRVLDRLYGKTPRTQGVNTQTAINSVMNQTEQQSQEP